MKNSLVHKSVITALVAIAFSSCNDNVKPKSKMDDETGLYMTTGTDGEMNKAMDSARKTFGDFEAAWKSGKYDRSTFEVKVRFPTSDGNEHMWADSVDFRDGKCFAVVANTPLKATGVKLNDKIEVKPETLSDWRYIDNGKLVGGLTIRVERNNMTGEERRALDSTVSFSF